MTNKEFAKQLENRTIRFAIDVIELSSELPNTIEANVIKNQLTQGNEARYIVSK